MSHWNNTTYIHRGDPPAVARALAALFEKEGMKRVDAPPRRKRRTVEPMQYDDALHNDLWGVAVFAGAPTWTVVKTAPLVLLGGRRPRARKIRLAELCAELSASAIQVNVYDTLGVVLAEVSEKGKTHLSGYTSESRDNRSWHDERLDVLSPAPRPRIHSFPEVPEDAWARDLAGALAGHLGGANAPSCGNLTSVDTLIAHKRLSATDGLSLYFRWTGPSRLRFSACDSWDEYRSQTSR